MGFDAGLYKYPIYKKEQITPQQHNLIEEVLYYNDDSRDNKWAREHFDNAKDYAYYATSLKPEEVPYPSDEAIYFFKEHSTYNSEFNRWHIYKSYCWWGSNGIPIYHWVEKLHLVSEYPYDLYVKLSKEHILALAQFCLEQIRKSLPQACELKYAFKYNYPKDDYGDIDYDTEPEIRLIPCDGVEVHFLESDVTKRVEYYEDDESFLMPQEYIDQGEIYAYMTGLQACLDILAETDFDNEEIYYAGGW